MIYIALDSEPDLLCLWFVHFFSTASFCFSCSRCYIDIPFPSSSFPKAIRDEYLEGVEVEVGVLHGI